MDPLRAITPVHAKAPEGTAAATRTSVTARPAPWTAAGTSPEAVLEKIRSNLGEGRYQAAQSLAREAARLFPGHPGVTAMHHALNEWAASTRPGSGVDRGEEIDWMRQDYPESLSGKVIALVGKEVVAAADTVTELSQELRFLDLPKRPLVFRVG